MLLFLRLLRLFLVSVLLMAAHAWAQDAMDQSNVVNTPANAGPSASCRPDSNFLEGSAVGNVPGVNMIVGGIAKGLAGALNSVMQSANSNVGALVGLAKSGLMLATMIALTIALYTAFIESHGIDKIMAEGLRILIITGLALTVIIGWGQYASSIPDFFKGSVLGAFGVSASTDPVMILHKPIEVALKFISNMWTWMEKGVSPCDDGSLSNWLSKFLDSIGIGVLLKMITRIFVMFLCLLILAIPIILFAAALLAMTFGTQIVLFIGMMFGPLMISMAPVRQMSWMVMAWVKFMLINSTTLAVAYIMALILTGGMQIFSEQVMSAGMSLGQSVIASFFAAVMFAVILIFFTYMVMRSDNIAQALFSGGAAANGASGFSGSVMKGVHRLADRGSNKLFPKDKDKKDKDKPGGSPATPNTTGAGVSNKAGSVNP
jgi:hypothetical protein